MINRLLKACLPIALLVPLQSMAGETNYPVDPVSGLKMAPGWELVNRQCNACHTSLIIPQNHADRDGWKETIQWMIDTQGLWDLSETWDPVLTYLSTYYGQPEIDMETFRRLPLENPFATEPEGDPS